MSAAAPPLPPPHNRPITSTSNNAIDHMASDGYQSYSRIGRGGGDSAVNRSQPRPFPHIKDIYARAESQCPQDTSLEKLLTTADNCLNAAQSSLDFKRPDMALSEYVAANIIMSHAVPRHHDAMMIHDRPRLAQQRVKILKVVRVQLDYWPVLIWTLAYSSSGSSVRQHHNHDKGG
jgi:hypothetical protein